MLARILMKTFEDLGIHSRHTIGCLAQPLALGIFADCEEDLPDGTSYSLKVHCALFASQTKSLGRVFDNIRSGA
jgi:hypothetical protein